MSESQQQGPEICDVINAKPIYAFIINRFLIFKELTSSKPFHNEPFDPPCIIIHYSDNCSKLYYNELSTCLLACTCIEWCVTVSNTEIINSGNRLTHNINLYFTGDLLLD